MNETLDVYGNGTVYIVTVGNGGAEGSTYGADGGSSSFGYVLAVGGGGGGHYYTVGKSGGSGGGGGYSGAKEGKITSMKISISFKALLFILSSLSFLLLRVIYIHFITPAFLFD